MKTMSLLSVVSEQKPRQIAVRVLTERLSQEEYTENLLEIELSRARLSAPDRGLCQELVYGIVRWQETLNWLIDRKTEGRRQKPEMQVLLQLGLYQMFWLDRIPNHAAVHETVEIAKELGFVAQSGFVNAVLRGYLRERVETEKLLEEVKIAQPQIGYSHPEWVYQRWLERYGAEHTAKLMEWNNTPARTYARINTLKADAAKVTAQWETEGVKFIPRQYDWIEDGLIFELESHPPLAGLKSFKDGFFYIQDPSTLLSVRELDVKAAHSVLDLCAAPGGKTTMIAQQMQNRGQIVAQDISDDRLALLRENYVRLGVTCVVASIAPNAVIANPAQRFDRVLIDAPCSNTGVMRRRVDLRWRIQPEEVERLRETQLELLRRAAPRLKPNGIMVYSTCSLEPEENSQVVQQFLSENPDFELKSERQLTPFGNDVDGAYTAKLIRVRRQ
ncbi:16S rRNA (cytosine(967)-C(5))-methyltransferase RsmB [Pedosphaera parvula]|uniref:16S rRNA (cytosine(967)-C(5))-methyltransferase n=1 Tax=Pedosphaera parvula (strain Ellin514) TaxID=320771 RepID=B9XT31_PEDPL|nr:16S rRNA (cytosine(967)-C(5))-methyltransferase RsmB [Pedosphaera parvula]EEF57005.1 sun protein [Pedosphaera parvula Ellin514]